MRILFSSSSTASRSSTSSSSRWHVHAHNNNNNNNKRNYSKYYDYRPNGHYYLISTTSSRRNNNSNVFHRFALIPLIFTIQDVAVAAAAAAAATDAASIIGSGILSGNGNGPNPYTTTTTTSTKTTTTNDSRSSITTTPFRFHQIQSSSSPALLDLRHHTTPTTSSTTSSKRTYTTSTRLLLDLKGGGGGLGSETTTTEQQQEEHEQNHHQRQHQQQKKKKECCNCIYLDYNGTTPISKRVLDAMIPYLTIHFGNPSSSHYYGKQPKKAIEKARNSILSLLYSSKKIMKQQQHQTGIIFTGCGTEADNLAIHLALEANRHKFVSTSNNRDRKPHIITSNVEHPAIMEYLNALVNEKQVTVTYVKVNSEGIVPIQDMIDAIDSNVDNTVLVTLMIANNESGSIQPIKIISQYCQSKGILFHTDAAQAVGKISLQFDDNDNDDNEGSIGDGIDMITLVGHKFDAPKGIACLYVKPGCFTTSKKNLVEPSRYMILGGGQEDGKRSGTENVPYIVAMGTAADILMEELKEEGKTQQQQQQQQQSEEEVLLRWQKNANWMKLMRDRLYQGLIDGLGVNNVRDNGPIDDKQKLPNTLNVGLRNINSSEMLLNIQNRVACSAGSACHATGHHEEGGGGSSNSCSNIKIISPVLQAMNVPIEYAIGTLRLSVGPTTTQNEIDQAIDIIVNEAKRQLKKTQNYNNNNNNNKK